MPQGLCGVLTKHIYIQDSGTAATSSMFNQTPRDKLITADISHQEF